MIFMKLLVSFFTLCAFVSQTTFSVNEKYLKSQITACPIPQIIHPPIQEREINIPENFFPRRLPSSSSSQNLASAEVLTIHIQEQEDVNQKADQHLYQSDDCDFKKLEILSQHNQKTIEEINQQQQALEILAKVKQEQEVSLELDKKRNEIQRRFLDMDKEVKELNRQRKEIYEKSLKTLPKLETTGVSALQEAAPRIHRKKSSLAKSDLEKLTKMIFKASSETDSEPRGDHPQEVRTVLRFLKGLCEIFKKASAEHTPESSDHGSHHH
jgi:hypothetical protein